MPDETQSRARKRAATYWAVGLSLALGYAFLRGSDWRSSADLHTISETVATLLALLVGAMALARFYAKKIDTFLFVGVGFLGTAFLDGYHAVVTSALFKAFMPSDLPALIPWSWVASRQFLSIMIFLSVIVWLRGQWLGKDGRVGEVPVYVFTAIFTLASFLFFAFAPLPKAYFPDFWFHRPEEFVPAIFFLLALIGYLHKGDWRRDSFEHWLVLSLIVGFIGQAVFMSFSGQLFDLEFDAAHTLKKVSYVCVLTGLLISMYRLFQEGVTTKKNLALINVRLKDDIAERKVIEAALRDSEARARAIVETAADAVIIIDHKCMIQSLNPACEKIFGYPASEIIGRNANLLMPDSVGKKHDEYLAHHQRTGETRTIGVVSEREGRRKDGTIFPMELSVGKIQQGDKPVFVGMIRDISNRKASEESLVRQAEELARSNEELSRFASVASHDLQEPLRKVQVFGERLNSKYAEALDERGTDYLRRMIGATERMQSLIQDLLAFSRVTTAQQPFVPVDLDNLAREVLSDLEVRIQESEAQIVCKPLPTIDADPTQMRQLLQNLVGNALKYRLPERAPVIKVMAEIVEDHATPRNGTPVQLCRMSVEDNGVGFEPEYAEEIFDIFQRLHNRDEYDGTGVGLAICRKIAERHGGAIQAEGRPLEGATFTVTIPCKHPLLEKA